MHTHLYTRVYIYAHTWAHTCTQIRTYIHTHRYTYMHIDAYIHEQAYIHTYIVSFHQVNVQHIRVRFRGTRHSLQKLRVMKAQARDFHAHIHVCKTDLHAGAHILHLDYEQRQHACIVQQRHVHP